jgi:RNA-directed DNA polymerase
MEGRLTGPGRTLNADKTRIVEAAEGLDVRGRHFRRKPLRSKPKRRFGYRWPSTRARHRIREKMRDAIGYDDLSSLAEKSRALNPLRRGWGQYFRHSNAHRHFKMLDAYVSTKRVSFLRRKHKRRGKGVRAFPPRFSRGSGGISSTGRWCIRSGHRAVNGVGKLEEGNLRVQFEEGALETG